MTSFDQSYRADEGYFGTQPEPMLVKHVRELDVALPVLDVGCGQGRNALFLARRGFAVDALDPSRAAIDQVSRAADGRGLGVQAIHGTFQGLAATDGRYGTILVFGLIPLLTRAEIELLSAMVISALSHGGVLFVTAFGTWDPSYQRHASSWTAVGANSFRGPEGHLRTYLEPGELQTLFPTLNEVRSREYLGPEHRHGDGPVERHGLAEAVLQR